MNRHDVQKEDELFVFKEFIKVCPLGINGKSIKSGDEAKKEPDIMCILNDGSNLSFELTAAVDKKVPHKMDIAKKAEEYWENYKNNKIPKDEKERFERIFSGCSITLNLKENATNNIAEKAIKNIFERYKNSCRNQLGIMHTERQDLPKDCESIKIEPKDGEPEFRCSRTINRSPMFIFDKILKKFKKQYDQSYPIHLLIYSDRHSLGPDGFWNQTDTKSYIEENIGNSPFERIWIFDWHKMKIEYVFPGINN